MPGEAGSTKERKVLFVVKSWSDLVSLAHWMCTNLRSYSSAPRRAKLSFLVVFPQLLLFFRSVQIALEAGGHTLLLLWTAVAGTNVESFHE